MFIFLLKGLLLGFCSAAPVGPIGIICIRNAMRYGWRHGVSAGFGAALADAIYGAGAALGLGAFVMACPTIMFAAKYIGGAFLIYLGVKLLLEKSIQMSVSSKKPDHSSLFVSTLALTLASPMTMASYIAMFSVCKLNQGLSPSTTSELVIGLFAGSLIWWIILSMAIDKLRERISAKAFALMNRISALGIVSFAIWSLY